MACKGRCGDQDVDKLYYCHKCSIRKGLFNWCVITHGPSVLGNGGNQYDDIITCDETEIEFFDGKDFGVIAEKGSSAYIHVKQNVFEIGELFPVSKDFEREMTVHGRKPSKWDIGYVLFPAREYKKALELACSLSKTKTNLEVLEEKYAVKVARDEKLEKVLKSDDPFKLVYGWIKQGHVTLRESKLLLGEVFKNVK